MDLKKTNAPVNTITYNKSKLEEPTGNIYEAITIMAKRANQINTEIKKELIEKLEESSLNAILLFQPTDFFSFMIEQNSEVPCSAR